MKQLGIVGYKKLVGVKRIPTTTLHQLRPRRIKPEDAPHHRISPALDAHLRAWWAGALAAGNLRCGGLLADFDYIGDNKDWPDLVHVGALAQAAGRSFVRGISKQDMGAWLSSMGVAKESKRVNRKNHRGRVVYTTTRVFYDMRPFAREGLTE